MSTITSRPYSPAAACEKCVFGTGAHANWCKSDDAEWSRIVQRSLQWQILAPTPSRIFEEELRRSGMMSRANTVCERCVFGSGDHAIWCPLCTEVTVAQEITREEAQRLYRSHPYVVAREWLKNHGRGDEAEDGEQMEFSMSDKTIVNPSGLQSVMTTQEERIDPNAECECKFEPFDDGDTEPSVHYKRRCFLCGKSFWSLHCIHEGPRACGCRPWTVADLIEYAKKKPCPPSDLAR